MTAYSVQDVMKRYGVGQGTVLTWINSGELAAINVGSRVGGKKKFKVTPEALEAFERRRAVVSGGRAR